MGTGIAPGDAGGFSDAASAHRKSRIRREELLTVLCVLTAKGLSENEVSKHK